MLPCAPLWRLTLGIVATVIPVRRLASGGRGGGAVEKLLRLTDVFLAVCDPASGHGGRVHRGEALLQQPGGHRQPEGPEEAQSLPLQEGNRDLQLLLLQHHPGRQAQQTGGRGEGGRMEAPGV